MVTIDGVKHYRDVDLFVAEVRLAARKTSHTVACQNLNRCMAGAVDTWYHDFLDKTERLKLINKPTPIDSADNCKEWISERKIRLQ